MSMHVILIAVVDLTGRIEHVYASVEDGQASLPCNLRLYEASVVEHVVWTRVSTVRRSSFIIIEYLNCYRHIN